VICGLAVICLGTQGSVKGLFKLGLNLFYRGDFDCLFLL